MAEMNLTAVRSSGLAARYEDSVSIAELDRILASSSRPYVLVSERELSVLRRGLTKEGWKRSLYIGHAVSDDDLYVGAGLLGVANRWLDVNEKPSRDELVRAFLSLALVYGIERDKSYSDRAAELILGRCGEFSVEPAEIIALAQGYDLIYYSRSLTDENKRLIEETLLIPAVQAIGETEDSAHPGPWEAAAVGVVGLAVKDAALLNRALNLLARLAERHLSDDGLWQGSVHRDHFHNLAAIVHLAEGCYRAGIDIYNHNWNPPHIRTPQTMFTAPLHYMYPSLRLPALGDGPFESYLPLELYEIAHRRWDEPAFAWILKRGYKDRFPRSGFYAFLFGRDLPGRTGAPLLKSHNFRAAGVCTLRTAAEIMATLNYGPTGPYSHLDKLSFTLHALDSEVVPDYGSPTSDREHSEWHRCTGAHNTVVVDGKSQAISHEDGLVAHRAGAFLQLAEAAAGDCYPGVTHRRRLVVVGRTCIVEDELTSEQEHTFDWMIHFNGEPKLVGKYAPSKSDLGAYAEASLKQACFLNGGGNTEVHASWECENGKTAFAIWADPGAEALLGACPSFGSARGSLLVCRRRGRAAHYLSAIAPHLSDQAVKLNREAGVITISDGDRVEYVQLNGVLASATGGVLQSDADVVVLRTVGGVVRTLAMINGSRAEWLGETLVDCPSQVDCLEVSFDERNPVIRYYATSAGVIRLKTTARAVRINGHRRAATRVGDWATIEITPGMLRPEANL